MRQQADWYAYLNLAADTPTEQVEQAVERLSRQATALAVTAPERSQLLRDTVRAIKRDLLSGPESRARYDASRAQAPVAQPSVAPPERIQSERIQSERIQPERIGARIARFLRTGWTCSSCGKEALPSDKFCTRCGTPITPTRHDGATLGTRASCDNCTSPLGANDAFCARCGTPVRR